MNFGVFFGAFSVNSERFIIYKARACGMAVDKHKPLQTQTPTKAA
jgi:hypothetical protein